MDLLLPAGAIVLVVVGLYVLLGAVVALAAYTDARRANADTRWHAGQWIQAIGLGPLTVVLLLLQRIIPDPPEQPH